MAAAAGLTASLAVVRRLPNQLPTITCGPRDNRGPLVRGRTLSTEAILAVQSLKRAATPSQLDDVISKTLFRLIKSDVLAALAELQRQNRSALALRVFVAMRQEIWYSVDFNSYALMISTLGRNGLDKEIDDLVLDLLGQNEFDGDLRGYARLMKALVALGKGEAVKNIYRRLKGRGFVGDDYSFEIVGKGLRRLGETEAADEVDEDYAAWCDLGGRIRV